MFKLDVHFQRKHHQTFQLYTLNGSLENSDHGKKTKSFLIRTEVTGNWSKEGYLCPSSNKI